MWLKGMSVGVCGELGRDCVTALGKLSTPYANRKNLSGSRTRWSASEVAKTGGGISFRRHRLISKTETVLCGPTTHRCLFAPAAFPVRVGAHKKINTCVVANRRPSNRAAVLLVVVSHYRQSEIPQQINL